MSHSLFKILSCFIFVFAFLSLASLSPAQAFPKQINYQGRAFDANNRFVNPGCYPIAIRIGRFGAKVVAPTGSEAKYGQPNTNIIYQLPNTAIQNTHPQTRCPSGQAYAENGLFNVILNLEGFNANFMASTLPYYGVSIAFSKTNPAPGDWPQNYWSLWQPLVEDTWIYPNTTTKSPQGDYHLASHNTGQKSSSWGLVTNHGLWADGGLGAPAMWLMGGDYSASILTMSAGGPGAGWYSTIDSTNNAVGSTPAGARPLRLNPSKGDVVIGNNLCLGGVCRNTWPEGETGTYIGPKVRAGSTPETTSLGSEVQVNFPSGSYTIKPTVTCTGVEVSNSPGGRGMGVYCTVIDNSVTKDGFKLRFHTTDSYNGARIKANWIAVGSGDAGTSSLTFGNRNNPVTAVPVSPQNNHGDQDYTEVTCPDGQIMVGVRAAGGYYADKVKIICKPITLE